MKIPRNLTRQEQESSFRTDAAATEWQVYGRDPKFKQCQPSLSAFAAEHQLQFERGLIPAKRGVIVLGNATKDKCFAAVLGLTIDAQGLFHWDKEERSIGLPNRTLRPLTAAGCDYDPAGYFSKKKGTAVIEFDARNEAQSVTMIKFLGVPRKRTCNVDALMAHRATKTVRDTEKTIVQATENKDSNLATYGIVDHGDEFARKRGISC